MVDIFLGTPKPEMIFLSCIGVEQYFNSCIDYLVMKGIFVMLVQEVFSVIMYFVYSYTM